MRPHRDVTLALYLATVATLPLARPAPTVVGRTGLQATDVLLVATYAAWLADVVRGRRSPRPDWLMGSALLFIGVAAASLAWSADPSGASVLKLAALGAYVLLPWLSTQVIDDRAQLRLAAAAWLIGTLVAVAVALGGIVAFAVDRDALTSLGCSYGRIPPGPYPRVCIPFRNPNLLANYLTASFPLLLGCGVVLLRDRWRRTVVAASVPAVISTLSTGIGGFGIATAVFAGGRARQERGRVSGVERLVVAAGLAAGIAAAVVTVGHLVPAGAGQVPLGDHDWDLARGPRVHTWLSAAATVAGHPLLGIGYGLPIARTPPRDLGPWLTGGLDPFAEQGPLFAEAHDVWLNVAGQSGLLGLAAFVFLLVQVGRRLSPRPLLPEGPDSSLPLAVASGVAGAFLFHGLFMGAEEARHVWALFGLGVAADRLRALSPGRKLASSTRRRR